MTASSVQHRNVLKAWPQLLRKFARREWPSVFVWSGLGALAAGLVRLVLWDPSFQTFLTSKYTPSVIFGDARPFFLYVITLAVAFSLGVAFHILGFVWRGLRSWWEGVTSGLTLLPFTSAFVLLTLNSPPIHWRLIADSGIVVTVFFLSFALYLRAAAHAEDSPSEDDLRVSSQARSLAGTQPSESDDPIRTWGEDTLGRASLVDSMCVKLMISKSPVLALFGEFGSGKTSTLNLLREHLADKAIVVSFSTWLPGSQDTFTAYLLSDIANACQNQYVVPGLRKSAQRLAKALGRNVPLLRSYLESVPAPTQKDDIDNVNAALARLPKRVIVLLDDLDRMERDELVTLLKVIRGISSLPNLSFVCAADRKSIVKVVKRGFNDENNAYFDKFFPVSIQVPEASPEALRRAGTERLVAAFTRRNWFEDESEAKAFRKQIDSIWDEQVSPFCRNLRAIGLLANDVGVAAAPLWREVHPADLTLIGMLRRFKPAIYEIVSRNSAILTGGESILRGGAFLSDAKKEKAEQNLLEQIQQAVPDDEERGRVNEVLGELFPLFLRIDRKPWASRPQRQETDEEEAKRISHPGIFPAYFRYELPEAIFSSVEMNSLLRRMGAASNEDDRERPFLETLDSMEKGSLRRDDFLRKLADAATKSMPLPTGRALVHAAVRAAHRYTYDIFPTFGEAGHVLRIVIRISTRLQPADRAALLSECIRDATDDTMALRILKLSGSHKDFDLETPLGQIYPSFKTRMRNRYGRDVDAANIDLSTSDPAAFDYWGAHKVDGVTIDPEDRAIQHDFWLRYIRNSKSRFARAFRRFFLPEDWAYSSDLAPIVENKISVATIRRLYKELPEDEALTEVDHQTLTTVRRFLDGEFKSGVGLGELYADVAAAAASLPESRRTTLSGEAEIQPL